MLAEPWITRPRNFSWMRSPINVYGVFANGLPGSFWGLWSSVWRRCRRWWFIVIAWRRIRFGMIANKYKVPMTKENVRSGWMDALETYFSPRFRIFLPCNDETLTSLPRGWFEMVIVETSGLTAVSRICEEETSDLILSKVNCCPLFSAILRCRFLAVNRSESFHLWIWLLLTVYFQLLYNCISESTYHC